MASRISFTAISASFAIKFGKRGAMAVMSLQRVKLRILPSGPGLPVITTSRSTTAIEKRESPVSTLNGLMFSWAMAAYLLQTCRSWGSDDYMLFGLRGHWRIHKIPYMLAEQVTQIVACSASGMMLRASEQEVFRTCARQFDD